MNIIFKAKYYFKKLKKDKIANKNNQTKNIFVLKEDENNL